MIMTVEFDTDNSEQRYALELIEKTSYSFFLTGRAGTGKTEFLKKVQERVNKRFVVLAPTGVAAINAGGQTIHSFFGLPFGVLGPGDIGSANMDRIGIFQNIDSIIVDEVSMVRCDIIDAMDRTLRIYRKSSEPFGGVQMIFVGDMLQLEPVVLNDDRNILRSIYETDSFYFYKAKSLQRMGLPKVEFRKIYRQTDPVFIELLEHIRTGNVSPRDLQIINSRVNPNIEDEEEKLRITLTSTKIDAQSVNDRMIGKIDAPEYIYDAVYEGTSKPCPDVADNQLRLKIGAQVMFTRNDGTRRWANGTLATVSELSDDFIKVRLENGDEVSVPKAVWENIEYTYDEKHKVTDKKVTGKTTQYPLRLAWAITIHKSQSLTFDRVAVDFGRKAFTNGQAYVALSRARSLEGLEMVRPMSYASVMVSEDVLRFSSDFNDESSIFREIAVGEAIGCFEKVMDWDGAAQRLYYMSSEEARKGNLGYACELMERALSYTVDDSCLKGLKWPVVQDATPTAKLLNATGLFYSGETEMALEIINSLGALINNNFDALYIKSRCFEEKGQIENLSELHNKMVIMRDEALELGLDSPSFRKFLYRYSQTRDNELNGKGAGLIRQLMKENPGYEKYHIHMRRLILKNKDIDIETTDDMNCELVNAMLNDAITEDTFVDILRRTHSGELPGWNTYRRFINGLKLSVSC